MVDLCHGPHLPNTGYLKSSAVGAVNRAFWRADVKREPLQVRSQLCRPSWSGRCPVSMSFGSIGLLGDRLLFCPAVQPAACCAKTPNRCLAARPCPASRAARVWGDLPGQEAHGRVQEADGGGEEARPSPPGHRPEALLLQPSLPGLGLLPAPRHDHLPPPHPGTVCEHMSSTCRAHVEHMSSTSGCEHMSSTHGPRIQHPSCPRMRALRGTSRCSLSKAVLKPKRPLISECKHPWLYRCSSSMQTVLGFASFCVRTWPPAAMSNTP